ncbi:MAG: PAC2 family protein [Dehalococcoidia bacterium]|nr:PAC2 family protein [Dehalococcoidia bacterium]
MAVKLYRSPRLRKPHMLAAWPGIGGVAMRVATYLRDSLGAEEFGEIESMDFFRPSSVLVENNVIDVPRGDLSDLPQSKFYYWKNDVSEHDLIIFIGDAQPLGREWDLADLVLDVAEKFKVERIYTSAAAVASISYSQQPNVWAAVTEYDMLDYLKKYDVVLRDKVQISGLNGLLLGVAKDRGIGGICLLGEVPFYIAQLETEYPKSSQSVLEVLTDMLEIEMEMTAMQQLVDDMEHDIRELEEEVVRRMGQVVAYPRDEEDDVASVQGEQEDAIPVSARQTIEQLFDEVAEDKSKAGQLKIELDRWNLFSEYEDRFLDIFRREGIGGN